MNRFVIFPLVIHAIITIFWIFLGQTIITSEINFLFEGEAATVPIDFVIDIDPLIGAIGWILGIGVGLALLGINILSSGLNEKAIGILATGIVYFSMWGLMTSFSFALFDSVPIFGAPLFIILTIVYAAGAVLEFSDEGGMD